MGSSVKTESLESAADISSRKGSGPDSIESQLHNPRSAWKLALLALPFGYLWFRLLNNLRLEWATDPQYGYGWAVPILCLGLLLRRWHGAESSEVGLTAHGSNVSKAHNPVIVLLLFAALAFFYLPTRLVEGATPEWRPIQWLLGIEAIGLTLCAIYIGMGRGWLRQLAFPICFLLVAIPWPTLIEIPLIQGLTRINAGMVVEVLGMLGVPAAQHGNVIEVATGVVGIDDACSGIRSFQSSLMISLFLGEFYWLSRIRRLLLVPTSFVLAIAFNVCRTTILTWIAAKKGTAAIGEYHDGAGLAILMACFAATWGVALLMNRKDHHPANPKDRKAPDPNNAPEIVAEPAVNRSRTFTLRRFAFCLLIWLAVVETGVELWYRIRESRLTPSPGWTVAFPEDNPSFKEQPIPEKARYLLRFDDGRQAQWSEADGTVWQAFYFNWLPGRVAGYLAKRHTPEICMPAAGRTLRSGPDLMLVNVHDVVLPVRSYVFDSPGGPLNVYQCRWEAGVGQEAYVAEESARYNLIRAVWAGRGNHGQKVLEIVILGLPDPEEAKQALVKELGKIIKVEGLHAATQLPAPDTRKPRS